MLSSVGGRILIATQEVLGERSKNLRLQFNETNVAGELAKGNVSWNVCGGEKLILDEVV